MSKDPHAGYRVAVEEERKQRAEAAFDAYENKVYDKYVSEWAKEVTGNIQTHEDFMEYVAGLTKLIRSTQR